MTLPQITSNGSIVFDSVSVFLNWTTLSPNFYPTYITYKEANDSISDNMNGLNGVKVFKYFRQSLQLLLQTRFSECPPNISNIYYVTWWNTDQVSLYSSWFIIFRV